MPRLRALSIFAGIASPPSPLAPKRQPLGVASGERLGVAGQRRRLDRQGPRRRGDIVFSWGSAYVHDIYGWHFLDCNVGCRADASPRPIMIFRFANRNPGRCPMDRREYLNATAGLAAAAAAVPNATAAQDPIAQVADRTSTLRITGLQTLGSASPSS